MKTKEKILVVSTDLFNKNGVVAMTTNHVAKAMGISPGNLYFHFANKEEIIRHIFKEMCQETYSHWKTTPGKRLKHPIKVIIENFEVYWNYRFFHREMYYLRRKDTVLNALWKAHIDKILRLMTLTYKRWWKNGWMMPIEDKEEIDFLVNILLSTASTFLHFFESIDKAPPKDYLINGEKYVTRLLMPYSVGPMREDFEHFVDGSLKFD
jgi:AcrR family transcriptional regulator